MPSGSLLVILTTASAFAGWIDAVIGGDACDEGINPRELGHPDTANKRNRGRGGAADRRDLVGGEHGCGGHAGRRHEDWDEHEAAAADHRIDPTGER